MLAELPPAAEAEVHPRIARVVVAALDGLVRVVLVAEAHEAVIVPETFRIRGDLWITINPFELLNPNESFLKIAG